MPWFWYAAQPNELFIDIDTPKKIPFFRRRLRAAMDSNKLPVHAVMEYQSITSGHRHIIIILKENPLAQFVNPIERYVWEMVLWGDIYRGCCNIMRHMHGVRNPDILISRLADLHRTADDVCECDGKHTAAVMEKCPAAMRLRGDGRALGFFGKCNAVTSKTPPPEHI